jgi:DNA-binding NarL/FixJ family response regulator
MTGAASAGPVRVVVSDDHPVVRQGLRSFLEAQGFAVVGEAADGAAAVRLVAETRPDVLLTDLVMPEMDGIEAIRRVRALGIPVGILVLTSFSGAEQVIPAIRAGADGYLLKDAGPAALTEAIRAVHRGEALLSPEAAAVVMARVAGDDGTGAPGAAPAAPRPHPDLDRLTPREREVLAGLGRGLSNRQLAAELFVSEKTVKTHVSSLLAKLRLADRTQAALFAVRAGVADPRQ